MKEVKLFRAYYAYKKDGHCQDFMADTKAEAERLAREYANRDNIGEPKSERLRFIRVEEQIFA
jgi:hypothetical protein